MGLSAADVRDITTAWRTSMLVAKASAVAAGGMAWQLLYGQQLHFASMCQEVTWLREERKHFAYVLSEILRAPPSAPTPGLSGF